MTSPKRILANRRNARFSTGPRTKKGKKRVAQNPIAHGVLSKLPIIPQLEDPSAYYQHAADIRRALNPQTPLELALVTRIATLLWRLQRIQRYEEETTAIQIENAEDILRDRGRQPHDPVYELAPKPYHRIEPLRNFITALQGAIAIINATLQPDPERIFPYEEWVGIFHVIYKNHPDPVGVPEKDKLAIGTPYPAKALLPILKLAAQIDQSPLRDFLFDLRDQATEQLHDSQAKLRNSEKRLDQFKRRQLIPEREEIEKIIRYETHIHRQFHRDLAELQKLQTGRLGRPVSFDVNLNHRFPPQETGPSVSPRAILPIAAATQPPLEIEHQSCHVLETSATNTPNSPNKTESGRPVQTQVESTVAG